MSSGALRVLLIGILAGIVPPQVTAAAAADELASFVKVGMTRGDVAKALKERRPGDTWEDSQSSIGGGRGLDRYVIGRGVTLMVEYSGDNWNAKDVDKVTKVSVARLEELKKEVGEELWPAFVLVHSSPRPGEHYDPVAMVRAVNGLLPMGKERVLKGVRAYFAQARATPENYEVLFRHGLEEERIFFLLRVLFERKDGGATMPEPVLGMPGPWLGEGSKEAPLYPIWVEGDLPFCLIHGYDLAGQAQSAEEHIAYCEEHCALRRTPLRPTGSPLKLAEDAFASARWRRMHAVEKKSGEGSKYLLREQALRCVAGLLETEVDFAKMDPNCVSSREAETFWRAYVGTPALRGVRWDEKGERFVGGESALRAR